MRLANLLEHAGLPATYRVAGGDASGTEITDVVIDSRDVGPGALFCCIRGARVDGHDLAAGAVAAGAVAVLADHELELPPDAALVVVPDVRAALGPLAAAFHGHPSRQLTMIGITGTNGKTTVTHLLQSIYAAADRRAAVIGTLSSAPGQPPTTPDAPALQARLAELVGGGVEVVAMEVSSHGLALRRVDGTTFAAAVFTNLSQDHLDVHRSMEEYFAAKARLFDPAFTGLAVVNLDDPRGRLLRDAAVVRTVGYSLDDARDLELTLSGSTFVWRGTRLSVALAGRFNVANAVAAATVASELGVGIDAIAAGLAATGSVRGRFEVVDAGQPFGVVVDYAHTPDGLEQLLIAGRELVGPGAAVTVVFGAGGDRDPGKRPQMGAVVARLADRVVVTSDNPRGEAPLAIIDAIIGGMPDRSRVDVEPDRRAAIALAVAGAAPGDLVLIAGKGHETTQTIGEHVLPFDDREVAIELLASGWAPVEDGPT